MKITVIGSGYVGLVTAACLAKLGNDVLVLDTNAERIKVLQDGICPIYEPGLQDLIQSCVESSNLNFTTDVKYSVSHGLIQMIAVGTPSLPSGEADLSQVYKAARNIGRYMRDTKLVINKSTVPVGTAAMVTNIIDEECMRVDYDTEDTDTPDYTFSVISNPEFLKEGSAIDDFNKPDRIIIGVNSTDTISIELLRTLYAPFSRNHDKLIFMDVKSAELTKYASNAMLATRISFMNELSQIAEATGADIDQVRKGIGSDSRIGYSFLYAGAGYGGSCFPKDVRALIHEGRDYEMSMPLLTAVENINNAQKSVILNKILRRFDSEYLKGVTFAVWGLAFKPNTDDMREAPSLVLIDALLRLGASVICYDPVAIPACYKHYGSYKDSLTPYFGESPLEVLDGAEALIIMTEWAVFKSPDFAEIKNRLKTPIIFDGRNLYEPSLMKQLGIEYHCIGRP